MERKYLVWILSALLIVLGIAELVMSILGVQFPWPVSIVLGILLIALGFSQILRQRK